MGNASSAEEGSHIGHPNLLSKVSVHGEKKADVDAFLAEGKVDKVEISYNTKRQVRLGGSSNSLRTGTVYCTLYVYLLVTLFCRSYMSTKDTCV